MRRIFFFVLLLTLVACQKKETIHTNHYNFNVEISPADQTLSVNLQLKYIHELDPTDTLVFYLYKNMKIDSLSCSNLRSWYADTSDISGLPMANKMVFVLKQAIQKNEMLDITLKYAGKIASNEKWDVNQISPYWIELSDASPWYLYSPKIKGMTFDGVVKLKGNYKLISNTVVRKSDHYSISTNTPLNDIVIVASNMLQQVKKERNGYEVNLNYIDLNKDIVDDITVKSLNTLHLFSKWFGPVKVKHHTMLVSPKGNGADYSRMGFYSLSYFRDRDYYIYQSGYLKYISREFARLWWNNADPTTWENWLNVSFTEYSAMMIIREQEGEAAFKRKIMKKGKADELYPPLKGITPSNKYYKHVMIDQASIILYMLENEIGRDAFKDLLKSMHKRKIKTTAELIALLEKKDGKEVAKKFVGWIEK